MNVSILLLSGPIAVGKSVVASELEKAFGFARMSSSAYLKRLAVAQGLEADRRTLQALGDRLDDETDFRWVIDHVALPATKGQAEQRKWLFDSVRKRRQVSHFRDQFGGGVFLAYLDAPERLLRGRYEERLRSSDSNVSYEIAIAHPNEQSARSLKAHADAVISVEGRTALDIAKELVRAVEAKTL